MEEIIVTKVKKKNTYGTPIATVYVKRRRNVRSDDDDDENYEDDLDETEEDDDLHDERSFSSHGSDRLTDIESRVSKATHRITRSLDRGVTTYTTERDKSNAKRRDGVVVDLAENISKGLSEAISGSAPVLTDVAEAFNTKNARRQIRRIARNFGRLPFVG